MRTPRFRPLILLASLFASVGVGITTAPPAAAEDTSMMLLANQYGGAGCRNEQVLIANPFTGALSPVTQPGTPDATFGVLNEAKPFDRNQRIVALWGGSVDYNQKAAIGVYNRLTSNWDVKKELPAAIEKGEESPHSIAVLPGDYMAVAHAGNMTGTIDKGFVILFDPLGNPVGDITQSQRLVTAHGVEWDGVRNRVFAVGGTEVRRYRFEQVNGQFTLIPDGTPHALPTSGGHDLRRRRSDNEYFLTTNSEVYIYRPDAAAGTGPGLRFEIAKREDGLPVPEDYVKTIDQSFDGTVEYAQHSNTFRFFDLRTKAATFCANFYKGGRWIWPEGQKVYPEDPTTNPPPPVGYTPVLTVGANSSSTWMEVFAGADVTSVDAIVNNGAYMFNLPKTAWGSYARSPSPSVPAGTPVQLIARRSSDNASAGTITFPWLQDSLPDTQPGWSASIARGANCSATWAEFVISSGAISASVKDDTEAYEALEHRPDWGKWVKATSIAAGSKVIVKASKSDGATAYSPIFTWLQ